MCEQDFADKMWNNILEELGEEGRKKLSRDLNLQLADNLDQSVAYLHRLIYDRIEEDEPTNISIATVNLDDIRLLMCQAAYVIRNLLEKDNK